MGEKKSSKAFFKAYTTLRTYAEGVFFTVLFALILRQFVLTPFRVPNQIMAPNVVAGDFVMAFRLPYGLRLPFSGWKLGAGVPHRGELIVFPCPDHNEKSCLRRVVALAGDRVEIQGERLIVNGTQANYTAVSAEQDGFRLTESLNGNSADIFILGDGKRARFGPVIVSPESVFVLSDHRGLGQDSRSWGGIKIEQIEARVSFVWLSLDWPMGSNASERSGPLVRWKRVFHTPD